MEGVAVDVPKANEWVKIEKAQNSVIYPPPKDPWVNRSEGLQCRTCMWFLRKSPEIGRCRRNAPTMSGFPTVFLADWCGQHKLDENKV